MDNQDADTYYLLGKCYEALARPGPARKAYLQARECDVCPLPMLGASETVVHETVKRKDVPFLDAHFLLEQESEWNMLGNDWLFDHVHPSIRGHQRIAEALLELMAKEGWVRPRVDWKDFRKSAVEAQFRSLSELYYLHGQQRLENLRAWTQGRADGPPWKNRQLRTNAASARPITKPN